VKSLGSLQCFPMHWETLCIPTDYFKNKITTSLLSPRFPSPSLSLYSSSHITALSSSPSLSPSLLFHKSQQFHRSLYLYTRCPLVAVVVLKHAQLPLGEKCFLCICPALSTTKPSSSRTLFSPSVPPSGLNLLLPLL
jgi:hypothetical protein